MNITQTVEIPASRRLLIDVPPEVPAGPAVLTFAPLPSQSDAKRAAPPIRKPISQYLGILSPGTYGDAVAYQRNLRDEWDD